ncbi:hypothetical protein [Nostoc sp. 106C]|nr:hypothetical protein [Nostoc sp. 106C]
MLRELLPIKTRLLATGWRYRPSTTLLAALGEIITNTVFQATVLCVKNYN